MLYLRTRLEKHKYGPGKGEIQYEMGMGVRLVKEYSIVELFLGLVKTGVKNREHNPVQRRVASGEAG